MKKDVFFILILLILSYRSIRPFFTSGFFPMHDDTQVGRVVEMGRALRGGQFPVRWVADLGYGYGYPLFNFYGPLPYYVGGFFYVFGLNGLTATKLMFILGILLAGISMFLVSSRFFGRFGGLISGLFYVYAPYHAVDIYVRGAVGEFWALVFLPLIIWGIFQNGLSQKAAIFVGGIGLAGIVLSHTILGYVTVAFCVIGLVFMTLSQLINSKTDPQKLIRLVSILLLGLGVSAFFWLPAALEMQFTNVVSQIGANADFHNHFVCLSELWDSPWGFGGSAPGCVDGFSFKLGKLTIVVAAISWMLCFWRGRCAKKTIGLMWFSLVITVAAIFMMLPASTIVWETLPGFPYIQYPWRFLAFTVFGLSLISGSAFLWIKPRLIKFVVTAVLIIFVLLLNSKLFVPQYSYPRPAADFESDQELKWRVSKISDEYLPKDFVRPHNLNEIPAETVSSGVDLKVDPVVDNEIYARFIVKTQRESDMIIRRIYFPGWVYILDGQKIKPSVQNGLPHITVPAGDHTFEISFSNTLVRTFGNLLSLMTVIFIFLYYGKKAYA